MNNCGEKYKFCTRETSKDDANDHEPDRKGTVVDTTPWDQAPAAPTKARDLLNAWLNGPLNEMVSAFDPEERAFNEILSCCYGPPAACQSYVALTCGYAVSNTGMNYHQDDEVRAESHYNSAESLIIVCCSLR